MQLSASSNDQKAQVEKVNSAHDKEKHLHSLENNQQIFSRDAILTIYYQLNPSNGNHFYSNEALHSTDAYFRTINYGIMAK